MARAWSILLPATREALPHVFCFPWPCLWSFDMGITDYYLLFTYFTAQQSTRCILRDFDLVRNFVSSWPSLQGTHCAWHGPIRRLLVHDIGLKSQKMSSRFYRRGSISKARWRMRGKPSWRPDGGGRVVWEAKTTLRRVIHVILETLCSDGSRISPDGVRQPQRG